MSAKFHFARTTPSDETWLCGKVRFQSGQHPALESPASRAHTVRMSTKQIVQDLLEKLPEDISLHDVAQETEFVAAVRQGFSEIDRGERIPIEEIERELPSWVIK